MRRLLQASFILFTFASSHAALAADECNASYEQADLALHASGAGHDLLEARERLRVCSRRECKAWMVKDCVKWLDDVESRIPSVVLVARDAGADVTDVEVAMDGKKITSRLDGRAIETNPGEHAFVFTFANGKQITQRAVIKEGEKAQRVSVAIDAPPPPTKPAPQAAVTAVPDPPRESPRIDLRTISLATAGAGVLGLGLGAFFGVKAMNAKSDANCIDDRCDPAALSDARSAATVSTIGFAVGTVLLAGGAVLFLYDMKKSTTRVGGAW
jgi:hypothetical protein